MSPIQSATSRWGWGVHTARSGIDPGDLRVRPQFFGLVEIGRIYNQGMRNYLLHVRRDLGVGRRGNSRRALSP